MKSPYIADLKSNQIATGVFLVSFKDIRQKKSGEPFLNLTLVDRTGDIEAKMWDNAEKVMDTFDRNDFVRVKGLPQVFQNRMQFTVHTLVRVNQSDVDFADYFPASVRNLDEMFAELRSVIAGMKDQHLKALLETIFADPEIARKYKQVPAAKSIHHAWLGGLIEHVLSLCTLCRMVGPHYSGIDTDLLLAGAILHDIGKIEELSWERGFFYTDSGQLIGHIVQGLRIVDEKARLLPDFPPKLKTLLDHMILAHHGELEFGSPKVPMFAEALLLHHLDNLDSKMESVRAASERDRYIGSTWTGMVSSLDRNILRKDRFLNGTAQAEPPTAAAVPTESDAPAPALPPGSATEAPMMPAQSAPAAQRAGEQPKQERERPAANSVFADRLKQALGGK